MVEVLWSGSMMEKAIGLSEKNLLCYAAVEKNSRRLHEHLEIDFFA